MLRLWGEIFMNILRKLSRIIFGNQEQDQTVNSIIICVGIGNLDVVADKLPPQEFTELLQAINNLIEITIGKYNGIATSHNLGIIYAAIPVSALHSDGNQLVLILRELWSNINKIYPKHLLSGMQPFLSVGVDIGVCLVSVKNPLVLGDTVINARKICKYAMDSNSGILISSNVVNNFPLLKNKIIAYGVVPEGGKGQVFAFNL